MSIDMEAVFTGLRAARERAIGEGLKVPKDPDPAAPTGLLLERIVAGHLVASVTHCQRCNDLGDLAEAAFDEHGNEFTVPCACRRLRQLCDRLNNAKIPGDGAVASDLGWRHRFNGDDVEAVKANAKAFGGVGKLADALEALRDHQPLPRGVLLAGPPGVGKTHLLAAMLRRLASGAAAPGLARRAEQAEQKLRRIHASEHLPRGPKVPPIRYWAWPKCMQYLFGAMRAKVLDLALDELTAVPVLALDELAAGAPSDFEAQTLNQLLVARHGEGTCTLVGTNYRLNEASLGDPECLANRLGDHTVSRLRLLDAYPMAGVDRRPLVEASR